MPEAVSDTGPVLHLQEIGQLAALQGVAPLVLPDLVAQELEVRGSGAAALVEAGVELRIAWIETSEWQEILRAVGPQLQPADAQVFALARQASFQSLTLTDDLALRRILESHGGEVAGSVGILVRAYVSGRISRDEVERSILALAHDSTLHLSRAFRNYLQVLLKELL